MGIFWNKFKELKSWRKELTDYEETILVPALIERLEFWRGCFAKLQVQSEETRNDPPIRQALKSLLKKGSAKLSEEELQKKIDEYYFGINRNLADYESECTKLIKEAGSVNSLKSLALFLNKLNNFCSSTSVVKYNTFFYQVQFSWVLQSITSDNIIPTEPTEVKILWLPFKVILDEILSSVKSTSETIHHWHKEQFEWKTQQLSLIAHRALIRAQIVSVIVAIIMAVCVSWVFLNAADYYQLYRMKSEQTKCYANTEMLQGQLDETMQKLKEIEMSCIQK